MPEWSREPFRDDGSRDARRRSARHVMLLADTFNRYFEPENLARRVAGVARRGLWRRDAVGERPSVVLRANLAGGGNGGTGARRGAANHAGAGRATMPVLGLEPSCLFTLRDEFRSLLPGAEADALADRAMLVSEFLAKRKARTDVAGNAGHRACPRSLPPEIVWRLPGCSRDLAARAGADRQADRLVVLWHGGRVRLSDRDAGRIAGRWPRRGCCRRSAPPRRKISSSPTARRAGIRSATCRAGGDPFRAAVGSSAEVTSTHPKFSISGLKPTHPSAGRNGSKKPRNSTRSAPASTPRSAPRAAVTSISGPTTPRGGLALVILLDQLPRNIFRCSAEAFAADAHAREIARGMIAAGFDTALTPIERMFVYLPFEHAETIDDQNCSVRLFETLADVLGLDTIGYAHRHREVIQRFGRFPHRNAVLGRVNTPEEAEYLAQPGAGF